MTGQKVATGAQVLLVEDGDADAELTIRVLNKQQIVRSIHRVRDGAEALDYLYCPSADGRPVCRNKPQIILLDLKTPRVDGMEVLRRVKEHPQLRSTPVVVLTSSNEPRDLVECYRLGVNSYVVKPVDFAEFAEVVRQVGTYWLTINRIPTG
jgi:two-component system response regulator